ncbi:MAG TPA: ribosome biogenesis GTPase Der [Candidatus Rhabdochlamydia sp.]|jgi:GTPase|nr:ribosome biogenesis GTPase Der [Candidatus Rhabdochlamydia sp.]
MKTIQLALVGRPNVGKSALFNAICKKRIAIVDEAEGITRDRLYAEADFFGQSFEVIDTGGIHSDQRIAFQEEIRRQAEIAIEEADVLIMVVDFTVGVTVLDEYVAKLLLRTKKRVVLAVNKVDDFSKTQAIYEFHSLGIKDIVAVSATQKFQIAELLEVAFLGINFPDQVIKETKGIGTAIIGRPNVGKSTIVNYLLKEARCVVSPIAGTTRDSIDVEIQLENQLFTLIDTAGIRKKKSEKEVVDKFAALRTERAMDRADVCVLVIDAEKGISTQEKRIANEIAALGKGCVLVFNKWDLVKGFRMEHCQKSFAIDVPFLTHCPLLFTSAETGRNIEKIFHTVAKVHEQQLRRVTTGQLNKFIEQVVQKYHPPMIDGKRLRIYYMAQIGVQPPRFVLFVNKPELMLDSYKKYLINQFRLQYGFLGSPIEFILRGRKERKLALSNPQLGKQAIDLEEEELDLEKLDSSYFE